MNISIAFIIFDRPECTRRTFAAIRAVKPRRLLVIADGPRQKRGEQAKNCAATRLIVEQGVDWPCDVQKLYSDTNLGCRQRVSSGLDWVFSVVDEAIILEDDCLPEASFFTYCAELLTRYRDDARVLSISGDNLLPPDYDCRDSYRFSHIPRIWGWATWRRAWREYDLAMSGWPSFRDRGGLETLFGTAPEMQRFWADILDRCYLGKIDTWDFQFCFASFARGGLHITPRRNLVTNLGFTPDATHTRDENSPLANLPTFPADDPLRHPAEITVDAQADIEIHRALEPDAAELARQRYHDDDLVAASRRFTRSDEFQEVTRWLGLTGPPAPQVLDLGCGRGFASYAFATLGCRVDAVDPEMSPMVGLEAARRLSTLESLPGTITTCQGVAEHLPFPDASFDVVYIRQAVHHFADLERALCECARVLKGGGRLLVTRAQVETAAPRPASPPPDGTPRVLRGAENAVPLHTYLAATRKAGLDVIKIVHPFQSVVNHYPLTNEKLRAEIRTALNVKLGKVLGGLAFAVPVVETLYRWKRARDNRSDTSMYSFLARKR